MNYYWFNGHEILQIAKEKYSKEKAEEYYAQNKEAIKEKSREHYCHKKKKGKFNDYQRKKCQELVKYKKEALKNNLLFFFP